MQIDPNIIAAIIGPIITALLGAATVGISQLRRAKWADDERARIISQAVQEAAFIESWLSSYQRLGLPAPGLAQIHERAAVDLERLYATIRSVNIQASNRPKLPSFTRGLKAVFLIPLQRPWAKVVRVIYYLHLIGSLNMIITFPRVDSPVEVIASVTTALALLALGYWAAARSLNRPRAPKPVPSPPTPNPPPPPHNQGWRPHQ